MGTRIEWCTETWNPVIGCSKISDGCSRCYAEKFANRLSGQFMDYGLVVDNGKWNGQTIFREKELEKPFHWKKQRMIFVSSMGDLFHESVDIDWLARVFAIMFLSEKHTFQLLTKRPERAEYYLKNNEFWFLYHKYCNQFHDKYIKPLEQELYFYDEIRSEWPLKNIMIGVTAENQKTADERIPILLQIPVTVRFVSCEPLLSKIYFKHFIDSKPCDNCNGTGSIPINGGGKPCPKCLEWSNCNGFLPDSRINWIIAGPETGPKARPMKIEWIRNLYDQCKAANVPFFDKRNSLGQNIKQYPI